MDICSVDTLSRMWPQHPAQDACSCSRLPIGLHTALTWLACPSAYNLLTANHQQQVFIGGLGLSWSLHATPSDKSFGTC